MKKQLLCILIMVLFCFLNESRSSERAGNPDKCTYTVRVWNSTAGKVTRTERVEKKYSGIGLMEREDRSGTGCTVCSEDQVEIRLPGIAPFYVCHLLADSLESALRELIEEGEPVLAVTGYRAVRSKGALNSEGERTELSNHAFGTAVDINRAQNGLYGNCHEWGEECTLITGGRWRPGTTKGSLVPNGAIVRKMKSIGFMWGGEMQASQKDFMHFSLTGF